jgi:histidine ammonia-lyase
LKFVLDSPDSVLSDVAAIALTSAPCRLEIGDSTWEKINSSHHQLLGLIEKRLPIYGVTTGFGDSCHRSIQFEQLEQLQSNLISYLICGSGPYFSREVCRAVLVCRVKSLMRGFSGVSPQLIERLVLLIEKDWTPAIPKEGSLGASGDLVPLAYIAQCLQGRGEVYSNGRVVPTEEVYAEAGIQPYVLKAKEGLAIVNGTSVMAGLSLMNLRHVRALSQLAQTGTGWMVLALRGRHEAFGPLVNAKAKQFPGQAQAARNIAKILSDEDYTGAALSPIGAGGVELQQLVQDKYSVRCAPQILGPILESLELGERWVELEINGVSDNPLIAPEGDWANGGNFYGGYLSHAMDYLKICVAHLADMVDRQFAVLIDEKSNRGLPPNLADWPNLPVEERFLHHGLKALHQSASAITSEILAKSMPNGVFSRSTESHNQDKVSLGLSAGVQCEEMIEKMYTLTALYFVGLTQGLDLREVKLKGASSTALYESIRNIVPRVERDQPLDRKVRELAEYFKSFAMKGNLYDHQ